MTEKGRKALGIKSGQSDRHGGSEHKYWVNAVAGHLGTRGFKVAKEVRIGGGKTIDIVATRDSRRIAFEIETGKSNAAANVNKCLDAGMDRVIVVATSDRVRQALLSVLPKDRRVVLITACKLLECRQFTGYAPQKRPPLRSGDHIL